ncbi:MAG: hypothetical protein LBM76_00510 [Mycoplasmataceae bacterium]|nr:hypothetical protein [Mycoplasmataceae bacterium]
MWNIVHSDYWESPEDYAAVLYCRITGDSPWDNLKYNGNNIPEQMGKLSWYKVCNLTYDTPRIASYTYAPVRYFYGSSVAYDYCNGDTDPRLQNSRYSAGSPCDERSPISHSTGYTRFGAPLAYGFNCNSMYGAIDYTGAADGFVYHTDKSDNVFKFTPDQIAQLNGQF